MNEDLRAMTLSLAIEYTKGRGGTPEEIIEVAKEFEAHIKGTGLEAPRPPIFGA